jgi:protein tyrosine/serine phosphatase
MSTDESYPPLSPSELSALLNHPIRDPLPCAEVKEILSSSPFIPLPYAFNLRTVTSRTLPPNKIFRSGSLGHVPIEILTHLHTTYGITTVYDLRGEAERDKHPSPEIPGIETVWIPHSEDKDPENGLKVVEIKIEEFAANEGVDAYLKRYENVLIMYGEVYKAVFERIRDGEEGGVLFHCTGLSPILLSSY